MADGRTDMVPISGENPRVGMTATMLTTSGWKHPSAPNHHVSTIILLWLMKAVHTYHCVECVSVQEAIEMQGVWCVYEGLAGEVEASQRTQRPAYRHERRFLSSPYVVTRWAMSTDRDLGSMISPFQCSLSLSANWRKLQQSVFFLLRKVYW